MWHQIFKRWIDLTFWWLPKPETTDEAPAPTSTPDAVVEPEQPVAAPSAARETPDDLTVIKGIGPVVQQKLQALGIHTFRDLAAADPDSLAEQLKGRQPISATQVRGWTEAADRQSVASH